MRGFYLIGALLICTAVTAGQPSQTNAAGSRVEIVAETYSAGNCALVSAGFNGETPTLRLAETCHGWGSKACSGVIAFVGEGVVVDQGQVLFVDAQKSIDVAARVKEAIGAKWPGQEYLHLNLSAARCESGGIAIKFDGSRIAKGASSSADEMSGIAYFTGPQSTRVDFD